MLSSFRNRFNGLQWYAMPTSIIGNAIVSSIEKQIAIIAKKKK